MQHLILVLGIISSALAADIPLRFEDFEQNDHLPDISAWALFEDESGIIWIGTTRGLTRYDGSRLIPFNPADPVQLVLQEAYILDIKEGTEGEIWIATFGDGLIRYNRLSGIYTHFTHNPQDEHALPADEITDIAKSPQGEIWVSTTQGLACYRPKSNDFVVTKRNAEKKETLSDNYLYNVEVAPNGDIWVSSSKGLDHIIPQADGFHIKSYSNIFPTESVWRISIDQYGSVWLAFVEKGLGRLDPVSGNFQAFPLPEGMTSIQINHIHCDIYGHLWLSTQRQGLGRFDTHTNTYTFFQHDACGDNSIGSGRVNQIISTKHGKWWVAHSKGLNYFFPYQNTFSASRILAPQGEAKAYAWPNSITKADDKPTYIATDKGIYQKENGQYKFIVNPQKLRKRANVQPVHSLFVSADDHIWIGTHFHGPIRYNPKTGEAKTWYERIGNITEFYEDKEGNIWFAIDGQGLGLWEKKTDTLQFFQPSDTKGTEGFIRFMCLKPDLDEKGIWISGVNTGLRYFDLKTRTFTRKISTTSIKSGLEASLDLQVDQDGFVWMATQKGLAFVDPKKETVRYFTTKDGLIDNVLSGLQIDDQGKIWTGGREGLSCFNLKDSVFQNFTARHGLADNSVVKQGFRNQDGEMTLVTAGGITTFTTSKIGSQESRVPIELTGFNVLNEPFELGSDPTLVRDIKIRHNDYTFTFFFSSPAGGSSEEVDFAYQLVGLDDSWINIGNRNHATFTSLPPDDYVFKVKNNANPSTQELQVALHISPAYWQTWWFKALIALLVLGLLGAFIWIGKKELDARQEAKLAQQSALYKSQFLANMSHEIRTPLHAVLGAADLITRTDLSEPQSQYVHHIRQSGKHLMGLLDDVLDFSKIEANKLEFNSTNFDLSEVLAYVEETLQPRIQRHFCNFEVKKSEHIPETLYGDPVRLGQILINLLNNAAQFTENGTVTLDIEMLTERDDQYQLEFKVQDNGRGIAQEELDQIFTSFYQASNQPTHQTGAGLGLAITKALVEQQEGEIRVESTVGKGTTFTCILPFQKSQHLENPQQTTANAPLQSLNKILMVEDMAVNRELGKDMLLQAFPGVKIMLAEDGLQALEALEKESPDLPDLILMDIRMPNMDGLTCTRHVRERYGGLMPILALSASATQEERHAYLRAGIDELLPKPFTPNQLSKSIHNIMTLSSDDSLRIDFEKLAHFLGDDEDRIKRYLDSSGGELRKHVDRLRVDLATAQWGQAQVSAHSLKTTFSYFGVPFMVDLSADLEQALREGKSDTYSRLLPEYFQYIRGFLQLNEKHLH